MKKIRFATIGTNFIVQWFLEAAQHCEAFEWAAAYSRNLETGQVFTAGTSGVCIYDSLADLASAPDIDAVYIASPTCCHAEQAIQMLESGKHVLCEKPAASNLAEWKLMTAAAARSGRIVLEAMRPLYAPGFQTIKEHLSELGTIRRASFNFCQYSSRYDKYKNGVIENAFRPEMSNGALMDIGIYCVESMIGLFGKPLQVQGASYILDGSIDAMGSICAGYDGMHANIQYSKISDSTWGGEIQGESGTLIYEGISTPHHIKVRNRAGSVRTVFEDAPEHDIKYELQAFIEMICGSLSSEQYHTVTIQSLELADTVRKQCGIWFPADGI